MFTVRWHRSAVAELADLWVRSADRAAINDAVAEIDRILASAPETAGESREESRRVHFAGPLAVRYEVIPGDRSVFVLSVWALRRR